MTPDPDLRKMNRPMGQVDAGRREKRPAKWSV